MTTAAAPAPAAAAAPAAITPATPAPAAVAAVVPAIAAAPAAAASVVAAAPAVVPAVATKKAPETYTDFTAPEGATLRKEITDQVKTVAKKLDLSQTEAQALIDEMAPALAKGESARVVEFVTKRADEWRAAALVDAEIGGDKFEANQAIAMKTFDVFGTPALREVLNKTGLGDNPELLRWAYRIGSAIGPDNKFVAGTTLQPKGGSLDERAVNKLWPNKP